VISPDGWFDLSVRLAQEDGEWRGVGTAANPKRPGLVGDHPGIVLRDGGITLQRSERSPRPAGPSALADQFAIFVGPVMEAVLAAGDHVRLRRGGRGERSVIVTRQGSLVLALGAAREDLPQFGIEVTYDPRADDQRLCGAAAYLDRPDVDILWLDEDAPDLDRTIATWREGRTTVLVGRCADGEGASALHQRVERHRRTLRQGYVWYQADRRFTSLADWAAYVRALPRERPRDLFVTFHVGGRTATIEEGGHGFLEPFHLAVPRIFTIGLPGTATKLAVGPAHPAVTEAMFLESAGLDSRRPAG
jgi:hypothetical protein